MLGGFRNLHPVDMIFKTMADGELIPVRFRGSGGVSDIRGYRRITPQGEYTTPDGVYLSSKVLYFEVECTSGGNRLIRAFMYYDKDDTRWYVSLKARS